MKLSRKKRTYVLFLALVFCLATTSFAGDDQWLPVTPEELAMKSPKVEPDADAEAIFWEVRIDNSAEDDFSQKHYVRVKIFTERGREKYAKMDIPYVKGSSRIRDIAARVIKPDGSIVEITEKDIFDREIVKADGVKIKSKSFAVPGIEPGVIVEYRYKEVIEGGAVGMNLDFQREIPVEKLSYYYKPYDKQEPKTAVYNLQDTRFVKNEKGFYLAQRLNVPAFKAEPRMPPQKTVRPWMKLQNVSLRVTDVSFGGGVSFVVKDPSNARVYWPGVAAEKAPVAAYMLKPDKEVKAFAEQLTAGLTTDDAKLRKIYEFCQTQIRNLDFETLDDNFKFPKINKIGDVLKVKMGTITLIDRTFGALAAALGYDARIAYSGDRDVMFFDPSMTNDSLIHPAAIAVKVGQKWQYFNPGFKFLPYGMLIWNEEGVYALLVGEKLFDWDKTPLSGIDRNVAKRTAKLSLKEDGTLEGDAKIEYSGQSAITRREDLYDESDAKREEDFTNDIKRRIPTAEVSAIKIENFDDITKPLVYSFKIRVPNYAEKTGKRMFLKPGFFEYGEQPVFSSATRKYDIYFTYPWSERDEIEIALPAGYALDNADQPGDIAEPNKITELAVNIGVDQANGIMQYKRRFHFGGGGNILFPADVYGPLKELFDQFSKADAHTITLKQK